MFSAFEQNGQRTKKLRKPNEVEFTRRGVSGFSNTEVTLDQ
jgi:hypothetical protein